MWCETVQLTNVRMMARLGDSGGSVQQNTGVGWEGCHEKEREWGTQEKEITHNFLLMLDVYIFIRIIKNANKSWCCCAAWLTVTDVIRTPVIMTDKTMMHNVWIVSELTWRLQHSGQKNIGNNLTVLNELSGLQWQHASHAPAMRWISLRSDCLADW